MYVKIRNFFTAWLDVPNKNSQRYQKLQMDLGSVKTHSGHHCWGILGKTV
jgi:hypothetical protein